MWSFIICFDFEDFLDHLHQPVVELENGLKCTPIITGIQIDDYGFSDINRGHYVLVFDLIPIQQQLTLF